MLNIFVIVVLYCAGPDVSAEKCMIAQVEPPHLIDVATCQRVGMEFADKIKLDHPSAVVHGVRCMTLADFMDTND